MLRLYYTPLVRANDSDTAHRLLRCAWAQCQNGAPMPQIAVGEWGKPEFVSGGCFSLSHAKTMAVAAICDRPVGVDVETIRPRSPRLYARVLSQEEQAALHMEEDQTLTFLRFWTLKEAYLKWTGTGLQKMPNDLTFYLDGDRAALSGHPEVAAASAVVGDCVISWCTAAPVEEVRLALLPLPEPE